MANPAPSITTLNAFDVTIGTTIDFNIVGGTEIVRSNKVYIYDMSDSSLICTHLYVSVDSIHILPPNTDPSIVYETGKSAADFVNEKQYYMQIQTFTDTGGTQNPSGLSISRVFWCLPTPSLDITYPTTTITTTSCNATAVYDTEITGTIDVTNAPQEYQFTLYKYGGEQIATSGVIIGSGEQSDTTYTLSHNFTGLENGQTYYIVVTISSTEGMVASDQSNNFLVNAGGVTLDAATVINNACGGFITVYSNLSTQYDASITKVLIKRRELPYNTEWLTLSSVPINQASDMDFVFIDFYNAYGKSYVYALVPIFVQTQSGIDVEIEGGYTQSKEVLSTFDGVFITDTSGIHKLVAGVSYNDVQLHQAVGAIETIGGKYPVIVSNNNMNYHSGTIGAYVLSDGLYRMGSHDAYREAFLVNENDEHIETSDGDYFIAAIHEKVGQLDREQIVMLREEIGAFLTNKRPKIIKDWNGNIFLVAFTDNVSYEFTNDWGMGLVVFSAPWTEIGKANNQDDLERCGMINLGGV